MNRIIKFRGKTIKDGTWVYGTYHYCFEEKYQYILGVSYFVEIEDCQSLYKEYVSEVNQESVGQYTGLKDKNGKEIYEGDIVRIENYKKITFKNIATPRDINVFKIEWNIYLWNLRNEHYYSPLADYNTETAEPYIIEIIGNIIDNKDLLV